MTSWKIDSAGSFIITFHVFFDRLWHEDRAPSQLVLFLVHSLRSLSPAFSLVIRVFLPQSCPIVTIRACEDHPGSQTRPEHV